MGKLEFAHVSVYRNGGFDEAVAVPSPGLENKIIPMKL